MMSPQLLWKNRVGTGLEFEANRSILNFEQPISKKSISESGAFAFKKKRLHDLCGDRLSQAGEIT